PDVVVAISAQRLPELGVAVAVRTVAPHGLSVWALTVVGAPWVGAALGANRVDSAEAGRGQGDEHLRVIGHGGRNVVVSTLQTGVDELPSITREQIRTRRAHRGSPVVAAREHLVIAAQFITASQVDRVGAEPHRLHTLPPGAKSRRAGPPDHLGHHDLL